MKANGTQQQQQQRQQFGCGTRQEKKLTRIARAHAAAQLYYDCVWASVNVWSTTKWKKCCYNDVFICWVYCHCPDAVAQQKHRHGQPKKEKSEQQQQQHIRAESCCQKRNAIFMNIFIWHTTSSNIGGMRAMRMWKERKQKKRNDGDDEKIAPKKNNKWNK